MEIVRTAALCLIAINETLEFSVILLTRRKLLATGAAIGGFTLTTFSSLARTLEAHTLDHEIAVRDKANSNARDAITTPKCDDGYSSTTPRQTAGPFYTPNTPKRSVLFEPSMTGDRFLLEGQVLTQDCTPVAHAMLDFWSCDSDGVYDNAGFRLRGHQFADASGRYRLETIKPGRYGTGFAARTPHIHVRVKGATTNLLTTQLYFPGEPTNQKDGIFNAKLVMTDTGRNDDGVTTAQFNFVLATPA